MKRLAAVMMVAHIAGCSSGLTPESRIDFDAGCSRAGFERADCDCVREYLIASKSPSEFAAIARNFAQSGKPDYEITDAISKSCGKIRMEDGTYKRVSEVDPILLNKAK